MSRTDWQATVHFVVCSNLTSHSDHVHSTVIVCLRGKIVVLRNTDHVRHSGYGYRERNLHTLWRLPKLCYEEKHRILRDLSQLLSAAVADGVLLCYHCPYTSIEGRCRL